MIADAQEYIVRARKEETPTTATLFLSLRDGSLPSYKPGQTITVYFPELSPLLGKQYSISSAPCERVLSITVKDVGRFSNRLHALERGEVILASKPQGAFCPAYQRPLIMLAGGMGITPFRSIVMHACAVSPLPFSLFYSARSLREMPFGEELDAQAKQHASFSMERFATREPLPTPGIQCRRMRFDDIAGEERLDMPAQYAISGSLSFVLGCRNMLVEHGIDRSRILTEAHM